MTRGLVLAACLVLADLGVAAAGGRASDKTSDKTGNKTSKVTIETEPPGAKVYFGLKEDGEICTTPCTVDAPIGETPIIVEAENRKSIIENMVVPRRAPRPLKLHYKLEPAIGTLVVEGAGGATIKIDDEVKGKAPGRVEGVQAGAHHIVVEKNGKALYDDFLEIEAGHEATVTPKQVAAETPLPAPTNQPEITTTATAPAVRPARPGPSIAVLGTMDIGSRKFHYTRNLTKQTQRDSSEVGQVMAGPIVELWPTTLLGKGILHGLALYGRFEFGVNSLPVTVTSNATGMTMTTSLATKWQSLEVSLHQRWTLAHTGTIEVGAGYAQDRYQFTGSASDISVVPDANYKAVRIGGRASLLLGRLEPYLTLENRVVLSGGAMDGRYSLGTSTSGFRGTLGAAAHLGPVEVRLEGGLLRYSWTFKPDITDTRQSNGGTDLVGTATLALGYVY